LVSWSSACFSNVAAIALAFLMISSTSSAGTVTFSVGRQSQSITDTALDRTAPADDLQIINV